MLLKARDISDPSYSGKETSIIHKSSIHKGTEKYLIHNLIHLPEYAASLVQPYFGALHTPHLTTVRKSQQNNTA